ncbi:hypothetical protein PRSY57_1358400 [Plasmodium reichenowi]|uniref:Uncharacterized protein n=1 Tax=Plasmodium reichenowi TaxID=5854 RepID=A0A151L7T0_PLARE|nr:hypothetical protein PRSY57_1358400 [Plasmodium reichenowi]KYN95011.1 hypothetical protein PRSY57_1358400 [Plasmodium reichenowi]
MNIVKTYYKNCMDACTPGKYSIDQNEINLADISTRLNLKIFDFYNSTPSNISMMDLYENNEDDKKGIKQKKRNKTKLTKKKNKRKNDCTHIDNFKILDNVFLTHVNETCNMNKKNHRNNQTNLDKENKEYFKKKGDIYIENAFPNIFSNKMYDRTMNIHYKDYNKMKETSKNKYTILLKEPTRDENIISYKFKQEDKIKEGKKKGKMKKISNKKSRKKKEANMLYENVNVLKIGENNSYEDTYALNSPNANIIPSSKIYIPRINLSRFN